MKLRWYQEQAIDALFDYWLKHKGNPVIALPTGTGKSVVIAGFIQRALARFPDTRILVLTHVKELIGQNFEKLLELWPGAPAGINSAGLRFRDSPPRRDFGHQVIFAGIGSVHKDAAKLGKRHIVLIDECHLVPPKTKTMYRRFLKDLWKINPKIKIAGLTATPYRVGMGLIIEPGGIFTDICFDLTRMDDFNRFIDEGFLAPLVPRPTQLTFDVSSVPLVGGDFHKGELDAVVNKEHLTRKAIEETIALAGDRKSWLVFAGGVTHSDNVARMLAEYGISAVSIHSESEGNLRDEGVAAFKRGEIRALVNNGVFTTGFDHPGIDLIVMLRHTKSPGLWVQMLGRGTRPVWPDRDGLNWHLWPAGYVASGRYWPDTIEARIAMIMEGPKPDCLVLDFARNSETLGPINDPKIPKKKGAKGGMAAPVKICKGCATYNHCSVRFCTKCKEAFPEVVKIDGEAGTSELIRRGKKGKEPIEPEEESFKVDRVAYDRVSSKHPWRNHHSFKGPPVLKVTYHCGIRTFTEFISLEHGANQGESARRWWTKASTGLACPKTVEEALGMLDQLRAPAEIRVWINKTPLPQVQYCHYLS